MNLQGGWGEVGILMLAPLGSTNTVFFFLAIKQSTFMEQIV